MAPDTATLEAVVAGLNSTLYNDELTLISITEYMQKPKHCFKLLNKILGLICGTLPVNMNTANPDEIVETLLSIIWRLRYKPSTSSETFIENFQTENQDTFLHIYSFLLANIDVLKQRYYVSQFLLPPNIPSEHVMDPTIQRLAEELKGNQERFKEVHMKYLDAEEVQKNSDISIISNEISKLTLQRDQLANQVESISSKLSSNPEAKDCVEIATKIRKTLHKIEELKQQVNDQRNIINYAESRAKTLLETSEKTKGMRITCAEDAQVFLDILQKENKQLRQEVEVDLPMEIEAKKEIISICKQTYVSDKEREDVLKEVTHKVEETTKAIKDLEAEIEKAKGSNSSEGNTVTSLNDTLNSLKQKRVAVEEHRAKLLSQQKVLDDKLESLLGSQAESVAEALTTGKTSSAALKRALRSYKTLSDKLRPLRTKMNISQREATIAKRTAEILSQYVEDTNIGSGNMMNNSEERITNSSQDPKNNFMSNSDKEQNELKNNEVQSQDGKVSPLSTGDENFQFGGAPISREKTENDANQLREAKNILMETEAELRERRLSLEPQLHKLTALRTEAADTENKLRETELKMQQLIAGNEGEEFRITREHNEMEKNVEALATELETTTCRNNILRAQIEFTTSANGNTAKTYQHLRDLLSSYNQQAKDAKEEFTRIQKDQVHRKNQKRMFENLALLLQTRIDVIKNRTNDNAGVGLHTTHGNDGTDVLTNPRW